MMFLTLAVCITAIGWAFYSHKIYQMRREQLRKERLQQWRYRQAAAVSKVRGDMAFRKRIEQEERK